jgi:hypothetical protein
MFLNQAGRKIITYKISTSNIGRGIMCITINTSNTIKHTTSLGKKEALFIIGFQVGLFRARCRKYRDLDSSCSTPHNEFYITGAVKSPSPEKIEYRQD